MSLPLRITVAPDEDVELTAGLRFAEVRAPLARVLGRSELAERTLFAGTTPIDDDALCGLAPLLPGAVLTTTPQPPNILDLAEQAGRAPWQLRVTNGADAGWTLPLHPGARIAVGPVLQQTAPTEQGRRRSSPSSSNAPRQVRMAEQQLLLEDASLLGQEFTVRLAKRGPRIRYRTRAASLLRWSTSRPGRVRGGRTVRVRRPTWRWRRLAPGIALQVGASTFDVTVTSEPTQPALGSGPARPAGAVGAGRASGSSGQRGALMFLLPAVGSLVMAVTMRQPLFALMALMGPVMMLAGRRRRPRAESPGAPKSGSVRGVGLPGGSAPAAPGPGHDRAPYAGPASLVGAISARTGLAIPPDFPRASALAGSEGTARARAEVCLYAAAGFRIMFVGTTRALVPWQSCRWFAQAFEPSRLASALRSNDDEPTLIVAVGAWSDGWLAQLSRAWSRSSPRTRVLLLESRAGQVPAWATSVAPEGGISSRSLDVLTRSLAGCGPLLDAAPPTTSATGRPRDEETQVLLPSTVSLVDLLDSPTTVAMPGHEQQLVAWISTRWRASPPGLRAVLGQGPGGNPVAVDLPADGPHALIAGTTGAGKSEFLQTLISSLALTYSPRDLVFALVDYKGGASFGACADLPHVVGLVTDLEPGLARRALGGLQAELHRRERLMAAAGVGDLDSFRAAAPTENLPRLMIVVDEFRAMADDLPDFLPGLLRIAAQGRSLGIHLVLATQRPGGSVNADMRANIGLRVCLRVTDPTDSRDVIDSPAAAALPASTPGRAVMVTTTRAEQTFQSAYAPAGHPDASAIVRRAPHWGAVSRALPQFHRADDRPADTLAALVAGASAAARSAGIGSPEHVWLPSLPDELHLPLPADFDSDDFTQPAGAAAPAGPAAPVTAPQELPIALLDIPAEQRRAWGAWDLARGHLSIEGGSGSGRTTALRTIAHAALHRGAHVHLVARSEDFAELLSHPGLGTVVDSGDPRRIATLLERLGHSRQQVQQPSAPSLPEQIVLVDDLEEILTSVSSLARGAGADVLTTALRLPRSLGVHVALATARPLPSSLSTLIGTRLVLASNTKHDDVARGIPGNLAGLGGVPGRAVWFGSPEPLAGQVAIANGAQPPVSFAGSGRAIARPARIQPVPQHVTAPDLRSACSSAPTMDPARSARTGELIAVGLGGDDGGPQFLDISRGALIAGPHGSGRSNLLVHLLSALGPDRCLVIARDGPLLDLAADLRVTEFNGAQLTEGLMALRESGARHTIVIDDADALVQSCPLEAEELTRARRTMRLIASATTSGAANAMRGPIAELRSTRIGIILDPGMPGSSDIFASPLTWLIEPGPCPPGRGVRVHGRDQQLMQSVWVQPH